MSTNYSDIITLVRAAIGDFGVRDAEGNIITYSYDYHDDDIAAVITLVLLRFEDYSGNGSVITPTLATDNDKGAIAYYVALILVLPGGTFSMEAPNMRYWVQANVELISHLVGELKYFMDDGDLSPSIWGALDLAYNEGLVVADRIIESVGAY